MTVIEQIVTTAVTVKANAVAALQAADLGFPADYGWPGEALAVEGCYLGNITWTDTDWEALGPDTRVEAYDISLIIWTRKDGGTQQEATERVAEMLTAAARVLNRNDQLLPTGTVGWALVKPRAGREGPVETARGINLTAALHVNIDFMR